MVERANASKACGPCRSRRTKCDLAYPCGQCVRGKWNCTRGMPKTKDINSFGMGRFRLSTETSKVNPIFNPASDPTRAVVAIKPHLSEALSFRALCYFHSSFVVGELRCFNYLQDFYQNEKNMSNCLSLSIQSLGIACLARDKHSPEMEAIARKTYASALQSLNKALSSHKLAKQDSTLSSVIVLNHFEVLLPSRKITTDALSGHLQGACALLKVRGPEQFRSRIGVDVFNHFTSYLTLICWKYDLPIPADFMEQKRNAETFLDTTGHTWRFLDSLVSFAEFRTAIKEGTLSTPEAMITSVRAMDRNLAAQISDFPPSWKPKNIVIDSKVNPRLVYESHYDVYLDYRMADSLNMMRVGRVILCDIHKTFEEMRRQAYPNEMDAGPQPGPIFEEMTSQICACVPQLAGYLPTLSSPTPQKLPRRLPTSNAAAAHALLWPLSVLANSKNTAVKTREWIIDQLKTIFQAYDLESGGEIIGLLETSDEAITQTNNWRVFENSVSNTFRSFPP